MSLNETLDTGPEGDALCLSDVVGEEDTMLEQLHDKENRLLIRRLVAELLTPREADIIRRRYGLDGRLPGRSGRWPPCITSPAPTCHGWRKGAGQAGGGSAGAHIAGS